MALKHTILKVGSAIKKYREKSHPALLKQVEKMQEKVDAKPARKRKKFFGKRKLKEVREKVKLVKKKGK